MLNMNATAEPKQSPFRSHQSCECDISDVVCLLQVMGWTKRLGLTPERGQNKELEEPLSGLRIMH